MRFTNLFAAGVAAVSCAGLGNAALGLQVERRRAREVEAAPEKPAPAKAAPREGRRGAREQQAREGGEHNMSPEQVQEVMGSPSGQASYPSAKTFNPYNFGNDSGNRVEYKYKGQGRVVFAVPKYGGNMKVVRVDYDPAEDGN